VNAVFDSLQIRSNTLSAVWFMLLIKEFLDALHRGVIIIQAVIPAEAGIQRQQQDGFRIKCGMTAFLCFSVF